VLSHAGGHGNGRADAVRMARELPNVYLDLAGEMFCFQLLDHLDREVPAGKLLFGSDFPWLDPRANLTRVFLAGISTEAKRWILRDNALAAYRLPA